MWELVALSISRENPVALYIQIAEKLKQEILSGEIRPGNRIGSQRELEERFKVSKITVRKAIEVLEKEELVITSHGKGTYVKPEKVEQTLDQLQSLSDVIKKSGFNPRVKINKMEVKHMAEALSSKEQAGDIESLYIERLHIVEDNPIALAKAYIPIEFGKSLTKKELEIFTIYELLENKLDITLGEAVQSIEAYPASKELGKVLDVPKGSPLLKAERLTYSADNKLVEKIIFYYRYDVFAFKINLNRVSITPMWPTSQ